MKIFKLICLSILIIFLSSCSKDNCENVSIVIINSLDSNLEELTIQNENYGVIKSGKSKSICLSSVVGYNSEFLAVNLSGNYEDNEVSSSCFFCGTGLIEITEGEYVIELVEVDENYLKVEYN